MRSFLLPGLGTTEEFYADFLAMLPGVRFLPNPSYSYAVADKQLQSAAAAGEKIQICGWSLGALFALRWAVENPGQVASLFLTGATARFTAKAGYTNGMPGRTLLLMLKQCRRDPRRVIHSFFENMLALVEEKQRYLRLLESHFPSAEGFLNGLQELRDTDLLDGLETLHLPVQIIHGREDTITPLAGARYLAAALPDCRLSEQPGGHCLLIQDAALCARFVRENIESSEKGGAHES